MPIKIINVVGARPNFMKIAPIMEEMSKHPEIDPILVHTGQHYDEKMSKLFFVDLGIPKPDIDLEIGSGSHAWQTAEIMKGFEAILEREKPDYILIVGDVNSTIACALTASKLGIKIIHVEAGLRSFDRRMPEEINRVLTDAISDILFTTEKKAAENLLHEGVSKEKIYFVGNVMIDSLLKNVARAKQAKILQQLNLISDETIAPYAVLTLHRPSNVDEQDNIRAILEAVASISELIPVIFPIHPRTKKNISRFGADNLVNSIPFDGSKGIKLTDPLGYLDFMNLMANSRLVLTDSGGMQEETTVLGIPCLTIRENTERPITVTEGTNVMVGTNKEKIIKEALKILQKGGKEAKIPDLWDGNAAKRIVNIIMEQSANE